MSRDRSRDPSDSTHLTSTSFWNLLPGCASRAHLSPVPHPQVHTRPMLAPPSTVSGGSAHYSFSRHP
eukprot:7391506-Prymnesium_polylepis.2